MIVWNEKILDGCWVDCNERQPEDDFTKMVRVTHPSLGSVVHLGYYTTENGWRLNYDANGFMAPVTHWFDGNYFEWLFENKEKDVHIG